MVSHAQIMDLLRRNANYNDMMGSTNGAGYIGGYESDNMPVFGGCQCCGGAYIGGAYIGGCSMCSGGASKGLKHCAVPKLTANGKVRCNIWAKGPHTKKSLSQYNKLVKLEKEIAEEKKNSMRPPSMLSMKDLQEVINSPAFDVKKVKAKLNAYRKCQPGQSYIAEGQTKKRCHKYDIYGKPPMSEKQATNAKRLGLISKIYRAYKAEDPSITRSQLFQQLKGVPMSEITRISKISNV